MSFDLRRMALAVIVVSFAVLLAAGRLPAQSSGGGTDKPGASGKPQGAKKDGETAKPAPSEKNKKDSGGDSRKDAGGAAASGEGATKPATGGDSGKTQSADEAYVRENLKSFLGVTPEFLENGKVKIVYDFSDKAEDHTTVFTPRIGTTNKDTLRWSRDDEDMVVGGQPGIRLSDAGFTQLGCWFQDDVEAEIQYWQYIPHTDKLVAAVVFSNDKGKGVGSNFGTQCALFEKGKLHSPLGKSSAVPFNKEAKIKLVVRGGEFEAFRDNRSNKRQKYSQKSFASGRIGLAWGGSTAATVTTLTITGKLDYPRMSKEMRKTKR